MDKRFYGYMAPEIAVAEVIVEEGFKNSSIEKSWIDDLYETESDWY
jgi:hypothetical protein